MKGLLKKDLLLLKSQIKYIVMIVVICLIMAYANSGFAYISSYLTFMGTGLVFNSFSYDMYHNEMSYLFALPFSKNCSIATVSSRNLTQKTCAKDSRSMFLYIIVRLLRKLRNVFRGLPCGSVPPPT